MCDIYEEPKAMYINRPRQSQDREEQEVEIYESADRRTYTKAPRDPLISSSPDPSKRFQLISAALALLCVILLFIIGFLLYHCSEKATPQIPGLCPKPWVYYTNSCCIFVSSPTNQSQSQKECEKNGGNLTVINDQNKTSDLVNLLTKLQIEEDLWIGLHHHQGDWTWVNGDHLSYRAWKTGVSEIQAKDGSAVFMMKGGTWNYTHKADNTLKHGLCEKHIQ